MGGGRSNLTAKEAEAGNVRMACPIPQQDLMLQRDVVSVVSSSESRSLYFSA